MSHHLDVIKRNEYLLPKQTKNYNDKDLVDFENVAHGLRCKYSNRKIAAKYGLTNERIIEVKGALREEWRHSILSDFNQMVVEELAAINADESDLREMFNTGMYQFKTSPSSIENRDLVGNMIKIYSAISTAQQKRYSITGIEAPTKTQTHVHADLGAGVIEKITSILTSTIKDPEQLREITKQMEVIVTEGEKR